MLEKIKKEGSLGSFLLKTLSDPVLLYTALVMMSIMYHYRSQLTVVYGLLSLVITWLGIRLFDFMQKHNLIGSVLYLAASSFFIFLTGQCIELGQDGYPISWGLWFLTPQDSVRYNAWYTMAVFLLFQIFMMSVIYYFTRVRYRIFMNFLIFIIPFAIYGKEYEKMPTLLIILMAVGYVLLMVRFRQLGSTEKVSVVSRKETWQSVAAYAVVFAVAATLIPKPQVEANRDMLETLINADALTDRLVEMLNVFRDTTGGDQFRQTTSNTPVYFADSKEPLRLKTSTFTTYDFKTDQWSACSNDSYAVRSGETPILIPSAGYTAQAIQKAAELDPDFKEKFGLEEFCSYNIKEPRIRTVTIYCVSQQGSFAPVPQFAKELKSTGYDHDLSLILTGLIRNNDGAFGRDDSFVFRYSGDNFFLLEDNMEAAKLLMRDDYGQIVSEAYDIMNSANNDSWNVDDDMRYYEEALGASYIAHNMDGYGSLLLDYGDNKKIAELAEELTGGIDNDYDKAKVLEYYFYKNGYTYDTEYRKSSGENAEDFIFDTKTGVCYEYATAMVLLARAAGIPARYCEGYNMQTQTQNDRGFSGYVATANDAHGFPELYIRGYGWMSFEPTMTDLISESSSRSATNSLARAGLLILLMALAVLAAILLYPTISHKLFLRSCKKRSPEETVRRVMKRICKIYSIRGTKTSQEAAQLVRNGANADISEAAELFDRVVYGEAKLTEAEKQRAIGDYVAAYEALKEKKKQRRKNKRGSSARSG